MVKAREAWIEAVGGPEVIGWREVELPPPGPGEVTMRVTAVGLNFIDAYFRRGVYPAELPTRLGSEAAGVVEAVGPGVEGLDVGDRVAGFGPDRGAYATYRNLPASALFKLPDGIDEETAAAALLKGCTAEFLAERAWPVREGDWVLVHAAAGGVGLILVQWLAAKGVRVIGTVGDDAKAALARTAGAEEVIVYTREEVAPRVRAITGGKGVRVSYDGVGRDTWEASLDSTGVRGCVISYGNASAPVTGVALGILASKGSLHVTRPTLFHYYTEPTQRAAGVQALWSRIASGAVRITIGQRYPLAEVARAHADLEARRTTGSTLLIP